VRGLVVVSLRLPQQHCRSGALGFCAVYGLLFIPRDMLTHPPTSPSRAPCSAEVGFSMARNRSSVALVSLAGCRQGPAAGHQDSASRHQADRGRPLWRGPQAAPGRPRGGDGSERQPQHRPRCGRRLSRRRTVSLDPVRVPGTPESPVRERRSRGGTGATGHAYRGGSTQSAVEVLTRYQPDTE
jgi:hypothetical protein